MHTMAEKCPLSPSEPCVPEDSRMSQSPQEDGHGDGRNSAEAGDAPCETTQHSQTGCREPGLGAPTLQPITCSGGSGAARAVLTASICLAQNHLLRQLAQEDFLPTLGNVGFRAREKGQQINEAGKAVLEPVTTGVLGSASHFPPSTETQISTPLPRLPSWVLVGTQERGGGDNTQTARERHEDRQ